MQAEFPEISQNKFKKFARLNNAKVRLEEKLFLVEGIKVVEELMKSDWPVEAILVLPEKIKYWEGLLDNAKSISPVYQVTSPQWKKLGQDKESEGLMAVVAMPTESTLTACLASTKSNVLILHEIGNPRNLGALMRSAHWFGFESIVMSTNCVDYTHPKAVRASMGSLFHLTIAADVALIEALPVIKKSHCLIGSDVKKGISPHPLKNKAALLLGSESHGLPEELLANADERWCISGSGKANSLSLPQAAAIMMYECAKK